MRIVLTGGQGQLGRQLACTFEEAAEVVAPARDELDITRPGLGGLLRDRRPHLVIHAAAMTNVDGAAQDPDQAYRINALGTRNVALACREVGAALVHVSSNEVFDGETDEPYREFDPPRPVNPYGASKLAAEEFVRDLVPEHYIVRTSWIFGPGGTNFVTKVLDLARQRAELSIVADEVANPTYAPDLAQAIRAVSATGLFGTYHLVNEGPASRYEFAAETFRLADVPVTLHPIALADYRRPSRPPRYSALRNFVGAEAGIVLRPWREALADYIAALRSG